MRNIVLKTLLFFLMFFISVVALYTSLSFIIRYQKANFSEATGWVQDMLFVVAVHPEKHNKDNSNYLRIINVFDEPEKSRAKNEGYVFYIPASLIRETEEKVNHSRIGPGWFGKLSISSDVGTAQTTQFTCFFSSGKIVFEYSVEADVITPLYFNFIPLGAEIIKFSFCIFLSLVLVFLNRSYLFNTVDKWEKQVNSRR